VHAVKHHAAVPFGELPKIMHALSVMHGTAAEAVRFIGLTACRASEALLATWSEIDTRNAAWSVPGSRTKTGRPHRVPLSKQALSVLREAKVLRADALLLFPGQARGKPLSLTSLVLALRKAGGGDATVHGLRSTFRTWAGEKGQSRELAEMSLGHVVGGAVERAYARSDLLDPRRRVMQRWGDFACGGRRMQRQ
jgi:integrase